MPDGQSYVIQAVKQVNFGPVEEVRYYRRTTDGFEGVTESFVKSRGLKKKNTYKNFRCEVHNKFFEINLYQENAFSKHTWTFMRLGQQVKSTLDTEDQGVAGGHILTEACNLSTLAKSTRQHVTA